MLLYCIPERCCKLGAYKPVVNRQSLQLQGPLRKCGAGALRAMFSKRFEIITRQSEGRAKRFAQILRISRFEKPRITPGGRLRVFDAPFGHARHPSQEGRLGRDRFGKGPDIGSDHGAAHSLPNSIEARPKASGSIDGSTVREAALNAAGISSQCPAMTTRPARP